MVYDLCTKMTFGDFTIVASFEGNIINKMQWDALYIDIQTFMVPQKKRMEYLHMN